MKTIEAKEVSFFYNPNIEELTLYSGGKFSYDLKSKDFHFDINPHGESRLLKIQNKKINTSNTELVFDINYKGKVNSYTLKSVFNTCKYAFEIVNDLSQPFTTSDDLDKVDLYFQEDSLSHLYISKTKDYQLIDSLRLIKEDQIYYLIKNKPTYSKTKVDKILVQDGKVVLIVEGTEVFFQLSLNPLIYDIFEGLVKLKK